MAKNGSSFKPGNKIGLRFGEGQVMNKGGKKKSIYKVLKESGYSPADIKLAIGEIAFYDQKTLDAAMQDEKLPIIMRVIAKQFDEAFKEGDYQKVKDLVNQLVGSPHQTKDIAVTSTVNDRHIIQIGLTHEPEEDFDEAEEVQ